MEIASIDVGGGRRLDATRDSADRRADVDSGLHGSVAFRGEHAAMLRKPYGQIEVVSRDSREGELLHHSALETLTPPACRIQ